LARAKVETGERVHGARVGQPPQGVEGCTQIVPGDESVVNAVNAAEVLAKLVSRGVPAAEARAAYDALHVETAPFESAMAAISARYVRKGVSLGDRCFLAAAQGHGSGWTSDRELGALFGGRVPPLKFFR
jgi:PIN domain nuclease of toxin-antitoxin system